MGYQDFQTKMRIFFLIVLLEGISLSCVHALPAAAMEPDYDIPVPALYDPAASPPSEIAYTFKTTSQESAAKKATIPETTPSDSYGWEDNRDSTTEEPIYSTGDYSDLTGTTLPDKRDQTDEATVGTTGTPESEVMPTDAPTAEAGDLRTGVIYRLYTRAHPIKEMILNNDTIDGTDFDMEKNTVFVIHGFTGDANSDSVTLVRDALLWAEDANVVAVDWAPLAAGPHYDQAVNNTHVVAAEVAGCVATLVAQGLPLERVHLVGFSLGAQVAGVAGGALARAPAPAGRLPRITALDPARPGFHDVSEASRLDASDADFVLVLHTASGLVSFEEPLGHADFYANSGRSPQPACMGKSVHGMQEPKIIDPAPVVCSHLIAPRYFAESIYKPKNFRSTRCRSWRDFEAGLCAGEQVAFLGPNTSPSTHGTFFFRTNAIEPYGRGPEVDDSLGAQATDDEEGNRLDGRTGRKHDVDASDLPDARESTGAGASTTHVALAATVVVGAAILRAAVATA